MSARERYRTSRSYTSNSYSSNKKKTTTTTGGGNNNRESYRATVYKKPIDPAVKRRNELALKVAKQKKDAEAFKNLQYSPPKFTGPAGAIYSGLIGKKTFETNKEYYEKNVIGKRKADGTFYSASPEDFKNYVKGRTGGELDAMGRTINTNDGDRGGRVLIKKNVGGSTILTETKTEAEKTAEAKEEDEYDIRKVKKRGRRRNILTSSKGITTASPDYSLGKPSLLGSV
jgi:hypothetical protein